MSLESRLALLQRQAGVKEDPGATPDRQGRPDTGASSRLISRLGEIDPRRLGATHDVASGISETRLAEMLGGEVLADGLIRVTMRKRLDEIHGRLPPSQTSCAAHPLLDEGVPEHNRQLYLDTETTGLSGGSGTLVFLVGIALLAGEHVEITQLLLTRYAGETAMLRCLTAMISTGDALVTYNGKSFDIPLLSSRYRINGLTDPLAELPHIDLLHPVRRLFSTRWSDCRLATAEQRLLAFRRHDDLPGAAAPEAWFAYIRRGEATRLHGVCRHNALDVISLPAVRAALVDRIDSPTPHNLDIRALARWKRRSDESAALNLLARHRKQLDSPGLHLLGDLLRRAGRQDEASLIWHELASAGSPGATERLAKYQEHVRGDLASALAYATKLPPSRERDHRVNRIRRKLNRARCGLG